MFGAILKCSKKARVLEIITGIYAHQFIKCYYKSSWLLKESRKCVFSLKKRYGKILKRVMQDQDFLKLDYN